MDKQPMFVITKSGLTIRPEKLKGLRAYITHYIRASHGTIDMYLREGGQENDPAVTAVRQQIEQAEASLHELDQLATEVQRIYDLNFVREAEIVRETLHALGFTRLEDVYVLCILVEHMIARYKAENPRCSEEKYRNYINGGELYVSDTFQQ